MNAFSLNSSCETTSGVNTCFSMVWVVSYFWLRQIKVTGENKNNDGKNIGFVFLLPKRSNKKYLTTEYTHFKMCDALSSFSTSGTFIKMLAFKAAVHETLLPFDVILNKVIFPLNRFSRQKLNKLRTKATKSFKNNWCDMEYDPEIWES